MSNKSLADQILEQKAPMEPKPEGAEPGDDVEMLEMLKSLPLSLDQINRRLALGAGRINRQMGSGMVKCEFCAKEFYAQRISRAKFCTNSCKVRAWRRLKGLARGND